MRWQIDRSAPVRDRSGLRPPRLAALLVVLMVALLSCAPASAVAGGPAPTPGAAVSRAHELGYSLTPSTTEPYLACPPVTRGHATCQSIIIPTGAARRSPSPGPLVEQGSGAGAPSYEGSGEGGGFSPSDLRSAYKLSSTGGSGQTVAIVDAYDDPNAEADMKTYRSHYGLSECTTANGCFKKVNQKGETTNYPPANSAWAVEISLDVDMVSAACPECHILLVEAANNESGLYIAEDEAATLGATEISNSWLGEEYPEETSEDKYFEHPGIPITVSSGDEGYGVGYPAASKHVISVGGTTLKKSEGSRGWQESAWAGTGSGCSAYESKPAWQADPGCSRRTDNDVAAVADPETPVSIYDSYEPRESDWRLVGGTSVGAPFVAGIEAHASKAVREAGAEALYSHALFDVTTGFDGYCGRTYLCIAAEGYDGPTGWGTPDGPFELGAGFQVVTAAATGVSQTGAMLNGYLSPEGTGTIRYYFEYGRTTAYGNKLPVNGEAIASGVGWKTLSQSVTLPASPEAASYHYRLVASRSATTLYGKDQTVTTIPWKTQITPNPNPSLESSLGGGVSCASTSACMAVGSYYETGLFQAKPLAERWNGTEWSIQSTPSPSGAKEAWLAGVSCASTTACTAVGRYENSSGAEVPLAERWNGTEWSIQSTPSPSGATHSILSGVSCPSTTACKAVGRYHNSSGKEVTLAERWNGTEWSIQSTPNPSGAYGSSLASVSCVTTVCTAVGQGGSGTLAERWNGTEWSLQSTPNPSGSSSSPLESVSCASSSACMAVGYADPSSGGAVTLAERWNGTEWSLQSTPNSSGVNFLSGVSCSSPNQCVAVGEAEGEPAGGDEGGALAERWNGAEWSLQGVPLLERVKGESLHGVSCPASTTCTAAGTRNELRKLEPGFYRPATLAENLALPGEGEWLLNGRASETALTAASKGTLKFNVPKIPIFGSSTVECASAGEARVGPGGTAEVTKLTLTGCKLTTHNWCSSVSVTARDLPWHTVLASSEGTTRELMTEGSKGAPGFAVECSAGGFEAVCTANTSAAVRAVTGGVDETFDSHSGKFSCTKGASEGNIEGTELLENPASGVLTYQEAP